MGMILVRVEKLNLNTENICNFCDIRKAVARVFTQTKQQYQEGIKDVAFHYCKDCGMQFAKEIEQYSV